MSYVQYLFAELRRRPGRTALTALGLAVGVGLVVLVGALSSGLDDAQNKVLRPADAERELGWDDVRVQVLRRLSIAV